MGMPTPVVAAPTDQESSNKEPLDAKTIRWHPDAKRRDTCFFRISLPHRKPNLSHTNST
jgi:hypothetical protein